LTRAKSVGHGSALAFTDWKDNVGNLIFAQQQPFGAVIGAGDLTRPVSRPHKRPR